jgi:acyl-CoA reductase-like NAD-dependent aldehyde dehydrogenase
MIDEDAAKRAEAWVVEATNNGAELLSGGNRDGSMLDATILLKTQPEMRVVSEEVFAPLVVVEPFDHFDDAIAMANNTKYGLQAGVFSRDHKNILKAAETLEFGGVIVNDAPNFRVDNMPYGGIKDSGLGREGVRYAMEEMTENRLIVEEK